MASLRQLVVVLVATSPYPSGQEVQVEVSDISKQSRATTGTHPTPAIKKYPFRHFLQSESAKNSAQLEISVVERTHWLLKRKNGGRHLLHTSGALYPMHWISPTGLATHLLVDMSR
jgi:hypothetical protein